ncbi:MAG: type II toxin-antitoxin system RelE/ParE family toxin [Xanthobacteraceae bacterium]
MNWKPIIRPRARLQIAEATDWYDSQTPGRGDDFLRLIEDTIESVCRNPYQYQVLRGDLRRAVLRRFPYLIIYAVSEDEVIVLRCVHAHRDPRRWLSES